MSTARADWPLFHRDMPDMILKLSAGYQAAAKAAREKKRQHTAIVIQFPESRSVRRPKATKPAYTPSKLPWSTPVLTELQWDDEGRSCMRRSFVAHWG
jgi:hypothetical protein